MVWGGLRDELVYRASRSDTPRNKWPLRTRTNTNTCRVYTPRATDTCYFYRHTRMGRSTTKRRMTRVGFFVLLGIGIPQTYTHYTASDTSARGRTSVYIRNPVHHVENQSLVQVRSQTCLWVTWQFEAAFLISLNLIFRYFSMKSSIIH